MKTSAKGLAFIAAHEGIVPAPYYDSVGVLTYGIGHTAAAGAPDPADMPRGMPADLDAAVDHAIKLFAADIAEYEADVAAAIGVPVTQSQFDAAVSFHFNTGAISHATWVETLNRGDIALAARQFMNWSKPLEVVPRREAEQRLFLTGHYGDETVTVWGADRNGSVIWKPVQSIAPADFTVSAAPETTVAPIGLAKLIGKVLAWLKSLKRS